MIMVIVDCSDQVQGNFQTGGLKASHGIESPQAVTAGNLNTKTIVAKGFSLTSYVRTWS